MPGFGAAALDDDTLLGAHEGTAPPLFRRREEQAEWHVQGARDGLQRRKRRRYLAVLDLRKHACGYVRRIGKVQHRQVLLAPDDPDLCAQCALQTPRTFMRGV